MFNLSPTTAKAGVEAVEAGISFLQALRSQIAEHLEACEQTGATGTAPSSSPQPSLSHAGSAGVRAARPTHCYNLKKYDLSQFSPLWKHSQRLTDAGVEAMCYAILSGMPIKAIANRFHVNDQAPYIYVKRLKGDAAWGYNKIPSWL